MRFAQETMTKDSVAFPLLPIIRLSVSSFEYLPGGGP